MMHEIVRAIGRKKHVTDLAAGLGGIIWQLDYVNCIQDINQNFLDVAELIAYQKGNTVISVHSADSIKEALPLTERGYFYLIPQWDKIELNQMNGNNLMQVPRPE